MNEHDIPQRCYGWTKARRQKQAEICRKTKPWKKSTGPKTKTGKDAVKNNALRHGLRSEAGVELRRLMYQQRLFISAVLRASRRDGFG